MIMDIRNRLRGDSTNTEGGQKHGYQYGIISFYKNVFCLALPGLDDLSHSVSTINYYRET